MIKLASQHNFHHIVVHRELRSQISTPYCLLYRFYQNFAHISIPCFWQIKSLFIVLNNPPGEKEELRNFPITCVFYTSWPHPVKIVWGSTSLRLFYCKGLLCSLFKTWITPWGCQAPDPANCITSDLCFNHITTRPFSCFCIILFLSQFFNTCIISFLIWYFDPPHVGKLLVTLTFSFLLSSYHFLLWGYLKMWCNILQWIIQHPPQTWHLSHRNLLVLAKYSDLDGKCYPIYHQ